MMKTEIKESTTTSVLKPVKGTHKWLVRLISEGTGSTGVYTKEALQGSFAEAFPIGTHMYIDHASETERWDRPEGTLTKLAAVIAETPRWQDAPEPGMYATIEVVEQWAPFIEQVSDIIGVSIHCGATLAQTDDIVTPGDSLPPMIESFIPSPVNSVDFVTVPGAGGRLVEALESFKNGSAIVDGSNKYNSERKRMDTEFKEALEALDTKLSALVEALADKAKKKDEEDEEDEEDAKKAKEEEKDKAEKAKDAKKKDEEDAKKAKEAILALADSDLPEVSRVRVAEAIARGYDAKTILDRETKLVESIRESLSGGFAPEHVPSGKSADDFEAEFAKLTW